MMDDLYGLYSTYFDFNPRKDLCPDNEVYKKEGKAAPVMTTDEILILEGIYGDLNERAIEVELSALLEILPRTRRRIDAYNGLVKRLKAERNCELIIKSRKTK